MSHSHPFSIFHNNPEADDSSTVFDADTVMVIPDEVPSLPAMPPLTAPATPTDYLYNNNESISSTSIQEESPANTISELLRRIKSQRSLAEPSTTTATATATGYDANTVMPDQEESLATTTISEEMSRSNQHQSLSSSSSKKRSIITNSSSHSSRKKTRQSSRLKRQPPQDQSCVDKSGSELEDYEPDEAVINQSSSSQISTTKLTKYELRWKNKFEELRAYKRSNGHANVLRNNKQLGEWVNTQRKEYSKFIKNGKGKITLERIEMLKSIGFEWVSPNKGSRRNESKWNERFNELKAYKDKYGDANVPNKSKDYKQLGKWVEKQRTEYKKLKKNEKSQITPERIEMLNSIGFEWVSPRNKSVWNERFNELKEYKKNNGHTNVPQNFKDNKQLGVWVSIQRKEYKKVKENKHSCMTDERIKTLESIDFEWVSPIKGGGSRNESSWNKRFNELKQYKEEYKDTNVPQRSKDNKQLGLWVSTQRTQYKKFQENKKSQITPERIDLLNSIGFQWECRPARASRS